MKKNIITMTIIIMAITTTVTTVTTTTIIITDTDTTTIIDPSIPKQSSFPNIKNNTILYINTYPINSSIKKSYMLIIHLKQKFNIRSLWFPTQRIFRSKFIFIFTQTFLLKFIHSITSKDLIISLLFIFTF